MTCAVVIATPANPLPLLQSCPLSHSVNTTAATSLQWEWDTSAYSECCLEPLRPWLTNLPARHLPPFLFGPQYYHHHHHHHGVNSENYCKDHCSGGEIMTNEKWNSKSNSFVAAAEQVCLQPVLERLQRRGRRNMAGQAIPHLCSSNRKGTTSDSDRRHPPRLRLAYLLKYALSKLGRIRRRPGNLPSSTMRNSSFFVDWRIITVLRINTANTSQLFTIVISSLSLTR